MLDSLREKLASRNNRKEYNITKQNIVVAVTLGFVFVLGIGVASYETGIINYNDVSAPKEGKHFGEFTKSAGPVQEIQSNKQIPPRRSTKKQVTPPTTSLPALPSFDGSALPSTMPNLSSKPSMQPPAQQVPTFDNNIVYARHASITNSMKEILNRGFSLTRLSDAPVGREDRFSTSFEYALNGNALEKFELMSIVRTPTMDNIKTANDALKALIEESGSVNIIEDNAGYLIYDFAGSGGYQIGKISVDTQGIYILGYINLTTNKMPVVLKNYWIDKLKSL